MKINKEYDLPPYWIKTYLVNEYLQSGKYKCILWIDSDDCIYNSSIKLKYFKSFSNNKIWKSPFNSGVFLVLNNNEGHSIMNNWIKCYDKNKWFKKIHLLQKESGRSGDAYEQGSFCKFILPKHIDFIHGIALEIFTVYI